LKAIFAEKVDDGEVITARQHLFKQIHTAMGRIPTAPVM
jgi:hypothetical protein